jgi:hypothetical protein
MYVLLPRSLLLVSCCDQARNSACLSAAEAAHPAKRGGAAGSDKPEKKVVDDGAADVLACTLVTLLQSHSVWPGVVPCATR